MTTEEKELLLKDLCSRLPHGVKFEHTDKHTLCEILSITPIYDYENVIYFNDYINHPKKCSIDEVRPYLFPLSNMTEEQYKEWGDLSGEPLDEILTRNAKGEIMSTLEHHLLVAKSSTESVNYCYKNHFDINGLIPMDLANDATGLNIY